MKRKRLIHGIGSTAASGEDMYFGDVLGKHSDISGELMQEHVTVLSRDSRDIEAFGRVIALTDKPWLGWNPLAQITLHCEACDKEVEFANRHELIPGGGDVSYCSKCIDKLGCDEQA